MRVQLERHFLDIIDNGRKAAEIFDVWQLSPLQLKEGWKTSGNDCIGRKVRRIYDNVTEADGRIMAYLPANPKEEIQNIGTWFTMIRTVMVKTSKKFELDEALLNIVQNRHVPRIDLHSSWVSSGHKWIGQKIAMSDENGNIVHANIIKYRHQNLPKMTAAAWMLNKMNQNRSRRESVAKVSVLTITSSGLSSLKFQKGEGEQRSPWQTNLGLSPARIYLQA